MPVFKVWNNDRAIKKCCSADTLRELKIKGCEKLGIDLKRLFMIVLEKDGTEIDEDEVLMEFKHEPFIFLQTGEQWESMEEIVDSDFVASDFNMVGMDFSSPDVRIIVSGMSGSGISTTANIILFKDAFNTRQGEDQVTNEISRLENMIRNKRVIVFDTPGLLSSKFRDKKYVSSVNELLYEPLLGPHVIVYVIKVSDDWQKEEKSMKSFVKIYGETVFPFVLVVFVHREDIDPVRKIYDRQDLKELTPSERSSIIASSIVVKMPEYCQDFCHKAGVGSTWISINFDVLVSKNNTKQNYNLIMKFVANSMNLKENLCFSSDYHKGLTDIRLVTVGKTGYGKSATGNTILQRECFESEAGGSSVTHKSNWHETIISRNRIRVIDTPGLFDSSFDGDEIELVQKEVTKSILFCVPGPHAFLFVIHVGRWTQEDSKVADKVVNWFGKDSNEYVVFVFTFFNERGGKSLEDHIKTMPGSFQTFYTKCNKRAIAVNNLSELNNFKLKFATKLLEIVQQNLLRIEQKKLPQYFSNRVLEKATKSFFDAVNEEQKSKNITYENAARSVLSKIKQGEKIYLATIFGSLFTVAVSLIGYIAAVCSPVAPIVTTGIFFGTLTPSFERTVNDVTLKEQCSIM